MLKIEPKNLKTGDLILFSGSWSWNPINWVDKFVEFWTLSPYSHVGMILKDPTWIHPDMTGIYLWESNYEGVPDPQDGKIKMGVEITPIDVVLKSRAQHLYVKQLVNGADKLTVPILEKIHKIVYEKPYDFNPIDWLAAYLRVPIKPSKHRFFCSAFVGCIYTQAGILDSKTDWTIIRPSDYDEGDKHLKWNENCHLEGLFQIK